MVQPQIQNPSTNAPTASSKVIVNFGTSGNAQGVSPMSTIGPYVQHKNPMVSTGPYAQQNVATYGPVAQNGYGYRSNPTTPTGVAGQTDAKKESTVRENDKDADSKGRKTTSDPSENKKEQQTNEQTNEQTEEQKDDSESSSNVRKPMCLLIGIALSIVVLI